MFELLDYRRQIADLYATIRQTDDPYTAWSHFRRVRDSLLRDHPQSPLDAAARAGFDGLAYYDYDPAYRVRGVMSHDVEPVEIEYDLGDDGGFRCMRIGRVKFVLGNAPCQFDLYWITGYGGGLFLPFADATKGATTYGGGRYLIDSIKGADPGFSEASAVLDFNFAYNPSCAYSPRWICPLAPAGNRLSVPVAAGEQRWPGQADQ
ncbi:MAG: DUF1684 domain-containing protein [Chloroflexi bacterium]|nr:DUF1684 domain-containing protein [Chloroflexota bacterium]